MKFRRKYSLKIFIIVIIFICLLLLNKKIFNLSSQLDNYFNSHHKSEEENIVNSRYLFIDSSPRENYQRVTRRIRRHFDRRLTSSQLSDFLFHKQGNFTLPTIEDIYTNNVNLESRFSALPIFPFESKSSFDDRIWNQMRFRPQHTYKSNARLKHILLYHGITDANNESFYHCPVNKCYITGDSELAPSADVILWMHTLSKPIHHRPLGQIWALYLLESPFHTSKFPDFQKLGSNYTINWTATYRHESTLVTPYFKYTPYDLVSKMPSRNVLSKRNYAQGKKKLIAWFVSNCGTLNNRLQLVEELQKYIQVDIYGLCGPLKCSRDKYKSCFQMLNRDYKFYLAFENSNCRDYITEKFFLNGLSNDILPIVMGAPEADYQRVAPPHSFIHIDQFHSIKELANYLYFLNINDAAYNEYFAWKGSGLVDTNSYFWCRLCMLAHEGEIVKSNFPNVFEWWFDPTKCTNSSRWNNNSMMIK